MINVINGETPFQILSSSFSIGPSETGYDLQVGADSRNFTTLFSVGANTPRMVTNVANGSYFRLKNNVGDVKVNWQRVCTDEGGGASGTELSPVSEFPAGAEAGTVIAYSGSSSAAGIYQFDGTDWVEAGGAIDPSVLEGYATSGDMQSAFTLISETQQVAAAGLNQLEGRIDELSGATPDLSAYWTSAETQDAIDEAISGFTPSANSPIIPAITSQAEYEAISGNIKTGDLIQVQGVVLDGYVEPQYGLFGANEVQEEEDGGVIRKVISWGRKDNLDSVFWSGDYYPWMVDNDVNPIEIGVDTFIISSDMAAEDEAYNGIGFDGDGKPVITHIAPAYDEQTGEITGITREDTPIGGGADMSAYYTSAQTEDAISAATSGKADAANVTPYSNRTLFPKWNAQGIITGVYAEARKRSVKVNGNIYHFYSSEGFDLPNIYTPANAGAAGDILVSNGAGAPVWTTDNKVSSTSVSTIWKGTQTQYDAIATKDPNTFYIIVNN